MISIDVPLNWTFQNQKMSKQILSLFSGGGFLDLGFMNQGFQVIEAIEFEENFVKAYNFGTASYVSKSQKKVFTDKKVKSICIEKPLDASDSGLQKELKKKYSNITGIIGGPPCQDFSAAGLNKGHTGEKGKLIFTYLEIVKKVKPSFIFFENVAGLVNTKNHQVGFFELYDALQAEGYHIWYEVINSLNLGIPQDRPRLAMVGFKKPIIKKLLKAGYKLLLEKPEDNIEELIFKWPKNKFTDPKKIDWPKTWGFGSNIIREEVSKIPEEYKCLTVSYAFDGLNDIIPNQKEQFEPHSEKFKTILEGDTSGKSFKRLHRYRYSPTVAYGNNEVHLHPTKKRRLSVREALRLQTVPDTYILPSDMGLSHKFKLISNGVPTKKADLIAQEIYRTLKLLDNI